MRFSTYASAAALAPALASAAYHADLKEKLGFAKVHNRCPYDVHLWSVKADMGCDTGVMKTLKTGESYSERYRDDDTNTGVSIKISKTEQCKGNDITQLEYFINKDPAKLFYYNYLDISFVDCIDGDCPGREAYYFKSGNNGDERLATAGADKAICPILACDNFEDCGNPQAESHGLYNVYINWNDNATKTCEPAADVDFYLCVSSPDEESSEPEEKEPETEAPAPSSTEEEKPEPTSEEAEPTDADVDVAGAPQVTPAPEVPAAGKSNIKTEVVYVTQYEYVNAKRHAHGHRHRNFRA